MKMLQKNTSKRIISFITACTMMLLSTPNEFLRLVNVNVEPSNSIVAEAADEVEYPDVYPDGRTSFYRDGAYRLTKPQYMVEYSQAYYSHPENHENDQIVLGITEGSSNIIIEYNDGKFLPIGRSGHAFKGIVWIDYSSTNPLTTDTVFFDWISDSAQILNYKYYGMTTDADRTAPILLARSTVDTELPMLANHVEHDENQATIPTWKVALQSYISDDAPVIYAHAGIIGEMGDGAEIKLMVADQNEDSSTYGNIVGTGDTGYICGKMGTNSSITVESFSITYKGINDELDSEDTTTAVTTNSGYSIETSSGNAGGVVGSMADGATLKLNCAMPNLSASVKAAGTGKYAGGIVGYNDGGKVELGDAFTTSSCYTISNTIGCTENSTIDGAGSIFGYYRPYMTKDSASPEFDVAKYDNSGVTVNGNGAVGGLFGVLENKYSYSETTEDGDEAVTTNQTKSGMITIKDSTTKTKTVYAAHTSGDMTNYGGLIGQYMAYELAGELKINDVAVSVSRGGGSYSNYGGMIGRVNGTVENTTDAVYVSFSNDSVSVTSGNGANLTYGGLISNSTNAFVDVGVVNISSGANYRGGGVIGKMEDGVLRLRADTLPTGVTNTVTLSGHAKADSACYEGNIVGYRDSSLVFAESGWTLSRSTTTVDDIGAWGEVITFHTDEIVNADETTSPAFPVSDVLTVDTSAHTVTILAPTTGSSYTSFSTLKDFVKTALCFKISDAENPILSFTDTSETCDTIKTQNIALSGDIDLRHTGITGFTRDNTVTDAVTAAKCVYSGTFNGGGKTIIMAVGEPNDSIYRHIYNGLFGVASGAKINNVTIAGTVNVNVKRETMYVGGAAARANGKFESDKVNVSAAFSHAGAKELHLGRLVGDANGAIEINTASTTSALSGNVTGDNSNADTCIGGMIGILSHASNATVAWNVNGVTLSGNVWNTSEKTTQKIGGLIACISGYSLDKSTDSYSARILTLNGVTTSGLTVSGKVKNTVTVDGAEKNQDSSSGGLLGYSWLNTNVNMTDVDISSSSKVEITGNTADHGNMAGLVYLATGKWTLTDLDINSMIVDSAAKVNSFGLLVNTGWYGLDGSDNDALNSSVLYLYLPTTGCFNAVTNGTSNISFGTNFAAPIVYDELVAYSAYYRTDGNNRYGYVSGDTTDLYVLKNRQGVISIHTDATNGLVMDSTNSSKSYVAQTSLGGAANPYSRYYYNLEAMTGSTGSQALMRWALSHYAHKSIVSDFSSYGTNFSAINIPPGTYDLTGYSWYPVDVENGVTVAGDFTFANQKFEQSEAEKSSSAKSSLYTNSNNTQHFLLHEGLFRNVTGTLTVDTVSFNGTIGAIGSTSGASLTNISGSGALVCGIVKGGSSLSAATVQVSNNSTVSLAGIKVHNLSTYDSYAPLLINKSGSYSNLILSGVSTPSGAYSANATAATSLIGIAGSGTSKNVNVKFTNMKLDARAVAGTNNSPDTGYGSQTLNNIYHTTRSIFTKSTFLHCYSFDPDSGSTGIYTFTYADDWTKEGSEAPYTYTHKGDVTYGLELWDGSKDGEDKPDNHLSSRNQYIGQEHEYSDGSYVSPVSGNAGAAFDFGQGATEANLKYLPYVNVQYNNTYNSETGVGRTYQLQVNHSSPDLTGCGTYNDPYLIKDAESAEDAGDQLERIAKIISGTYDAKSICIPKMDAAKVCSSADDAVIATTWENTNGHASFTHKAASGSNPEGFYLDDTYPATLTKGTNYLTNEQVRTYLAGAYYKLGSNVTIDATDASSGFKGLGSSSDDFAAFRGVIHGGGYTITNQTNYPLIASSYGSVVKNVDIVVDSDITKTQGKVNNSCPKFLLDSGCQNYGAVIGQIFGGDNIIDTTTVTFAAGHTITLTGTYNQLIPVGGYVGVIENGGLFFRNMARTDNNNKELLYDESIFDGVSFKSSTAANVAVLSPSPVADSNTKWLYVNPIVGRVLNGYAVTESIDNKYRPFEDGTRTYPDNTTDSLNGHVTMQNGKKNYSIADINKNDTTTFDMSGIADESTITISSTQALYIMSLITECGLGKSINGTYNQITELTPYNSYMATHNEATFEYVGYATESATTDHDKTASDTFSGAGTDKLPYIIKKYTNTVTVGSNTVYPAFGAMGNYNINTTHKTQTTATAAAAENRFLNLVFSDSISNFYLPDSYRGLGSIMFGVDKGTSENLDDFKNNVMVLSSLDGNGNTVSENMNLTVYTDDNYLPLAGHQAFFKTGFGFINCLQSKTATSKSFKDLTLRGGVKFMKIARADGTTDFTSSITSTANPAVSAFIGVPVPDRNNTNDAPSVGYNVKIENITIDSMDISGVRFAGGFLGTLNIKGEFTFEQCKSDDLKVFSRGASGSLMGYMRNANAMINVTDSTFGIISIVSAASASNITESHAGAGGLIGNRETTQTYTGESANLVFTNVTVQNGNSVDAGYIGYYDDELTTGSNSNPDIPAAGSLIGYSSKISIISADNVSAKNLNICGAYAGGMVGFLDGDGSQATFKNCSVTTDAVLDEDTGEKCRIESKYNNAAAASGGFIGKNAAPNASEFDICAVDGYTIAGYKNVGGLIGYNSNSSLPSVNAKNVDIENHTLKCDNKVGGLVGYQQYGELDGYNILIKNQTTAVNTADSITDNGYIVGNNSSQVIKIAGFSRQGEIGTAAMVGSGDYGTDGYVVFADYNDTASASGANNQFSTIGAPVGETPYSIDVNTFESVGNGSTHDERDYVIIAQHGSDGTVTVKQIVSNTPDAAKSGEFNTLDERASEGVPYNVATGTRQKWIMGSAGGFVSDASTFSNSNISEGVYLYSNKESKYFKGVPLYNKSGSNLAIALVSTANNTTGAGIWYFNPVAGEDDTYLVYTLDSYDQPQYIKIGTSNSSTVYNMAVTDNESEAAHITVSNYDTNIISLSTLLGNTTFYIGYSGNAGGMRFSTTAPDNSKDGPNSRIKINVRPTSDKFVTENYLPTCPADGFSPTVDVALSGSASNPQEASVAQQSAYDALLTANSFDNTNKDYEIYNIHKAYIVNHYDHINPKPYVTTNPKKIISATQFLTGDALGYSGSMTYANSTLAAILGDLATFSQSTDENGNVIVTCTGLETADPKGYSKAFSGAGADNLATLYKSLVVNGNYSTYKTEMGASAGTTYDFPILVLNDANKITSTNIINTYLRALTNTDYNFATGKYSDGTSAASVFNVEVGRCTYSGGVVTADFTDSCLKHSSTQFYIDNSYDNVSRTGQFSLIDVQFYDPSGTGKIAYHLYVPVLVKKMFRYDFTISMLSGTSYLMSDYEDYIDSNDSSNNIYRRGNNLIENAGNPITMQFRWTYRLTADEWKSQIEGGEQLLRNYAKKLTITDVFGNDLPSGTRMLLVDANNNNKVYYADPYTDAYKTNNGDFIDLSGFDGFTPVELNDFLSITMTDTPNPNTLGQKTFDKIVLAEGVEATEANYKAAGATFHDDTGNYYKPNDEGTGSYVINTCSIKASMTGSYTESGVTYQGAAENYYITILTPMTTNFHHLEVSVPPRFEGDYPSLIFENKTSHLFTGNIFTNKFGPMDDLPDPDNPSILTDEENGFGIKTMNDVQVMGTSDLTTDTDQVRVKMRAQIGLTPIARTNLSSTIGTGSVSVYQSFLLSTIQQDYSQAQSKEVKAVPEITYTAFTVGGDDVRTRVTPIASVSNKNYIELRDNYNLNTKLASGDVVVFADYTLTYDGAQIAAQFPYRNTQKTGYQYVGTLFSGSSNISSNASAAAYSKTTTSNTDNAKLYYCSEIASASLAYDSDDAANQKGEFYQLGINALELDDTATENGYVSMKTRATYDASALANASTAASMKIRLRVKKKSDSYSDPQTISTFLVEDSIVLNNSDFEFNEEDTTEFVCIIPTPTSNVDLDYDSTNQVYSIPIVFSAYTGDNETFEDLRKEYSNYMVEIEISLHSDATATDANIIPGSDKSDHVIYTNAKLLNSIVTHN